MHRRALLLSAASSALVACNAQRPAMGKRQRVPPTSLPVATPSAGAFDIDLYRAVAAGGGNLFVSPFSVACAFALVYPGARGQTAAEIAPTFGFDPSPAAQADADARASEH